MNLKNILIALLLFLPLISFSQSKVLEDFKEKYPRADYKYFYGSVLRALTNVAGGEDAVELIKGIDKVVMVNITDTLGIKKGYYNDIRSQLKAEKYEPYFELTNRGNMPSLSNYLFSLLKLKGKEDESVASEALDLPEGGKMAVLAIDTDKMISGLCIIILGETTLQFIEVQGKLKINSIPDMMERVNKLMELFDEIR